MVSNKILFRTCEEFNRLEATVLCGFTFHQKELTRLPTSDAPLHVTLQLAVKAFPGASQAVRQLTWFAKLWNPRKVYSVHSIPEGGFHP